MKPQLTFIRNCNPSKDGVANGKVTKNHRLYLHVWKTGHQELIFETVEKAQKFAITNELELA